MAQIIWADPALNDLEEIAAYIALDKPEASKKLIRNIFKSIEKLAFFPEIGRKPPELESDSRYRELIVGPCRIFYRFENDIIYIVFVMRSARLLTKYIIDERVKSK